MATIAHQEMQLPGNYIITRQLTDGTYREQYAKLEGTIEGIEGQTIYTGYYGNHGYHEVYVKLENIRKMTLKENTAHDAKKYSELPQQFYQSFMPYVLCKNKQSSQN